MASLAEQNNSKVDFPYIPRDTNKLANDWRHGIQHSNRRYPGTDHGISDFDRISAWGNHCWSHTQDDILHADHHSILANIDRIQHHSVHGIRHSPRMDWPNKDYVFLQSLNRQLYFLVKNTFAIRALLVSYMVRLQNIQRKDHQYSLERMCTGLHEIEHGIQHLDRTIHGKDRNIFD